ncbi:MAG: DUF4834 family protein [Bacteroidota bacterium]|nr:DUF4834 family protein [Bacteroidota bacterium]
MQEIFFTVLAIWLVWKLFSSFTGSDSSSRKQQQTTHHHYYQTPPKQDGEVRIEKKVSPESKIPPTEGEYVDYEDIK